MSTPAPPSSNIAEYTVSEISAAIKRTMEDTFSFVRVRGEIGRISRPSSGHVYLDLKDERAVLAGVIWKSVAGRLAFKPEEGLEVIATGRITTYPGSSKYQIVIESLEPAGVGALMALLEERKRKLAAEGLFDEARKKPLPFLPRVIGVVTSPSGAVIRDILHGFEERFPSRVIVWPVRVQGETCAPEVAAAIRGFDALRPGGPIPRPEVLIVARGGGSLEDLWGFNEEVVARAAAECTIPLISAVGHETDWTLLDLAADSRAPTPTKAAEWAVPKRADLITRVVEMRERLMRAVRRLIEARRTELRGAARGLPRPQDLLALPRQRVDTAASRLALARSTYATVRRGEFRQWGARLRPQLLKDHVARAANRLASISQRAHHAFARLIHVKRSAADRVCLRLAPRLLTSRVERASDKLVRARRDLSQHYVRYITTQRAQWERHAARLNPRLLQIPAMHARDNLANRTARLHRAFAVNAQKERRRLDAQAQLLTALSYKRVLERGFALVHDAGGRMVRQAAVARTLREVEIEFADGCVPAHISRGDSASGTESAEEQRLSPQSNKGNMSNLSRSTKTRAGAAKGKGRQGRFF